MPAEGAEPGIVRFDCYELDLAAGQLRKRGVRIRLRGQPIQVLAMLLEHPGQVVTREELHQRLWPRDVFVDFENNLNTAIGRLREALGDSAAHPRFIETLSRHGYRFIGKVPQVAQVPDETPTPKVRLLVLPFVNSTGDLAQEYLSDAVTNEITTELAALAPKHLAVIARTTAMHYKGSAKDVARIGRELAVDYVVEGGVLVRRRSDSHHRAAHSGRRSGTGVCQQLRCRPAGHVHDGEDSRACDCCAHRRAGSRRRDSRRAGSRPARREEAYRGSRGVRPLHSGPLPPRQANPPRLRPGKSSVSKEPSLGIRNLPWPTTALADVYWNVGYFGFAPPKETFSAGVLYALRALEIDNTLAETHALLGQYHKQLDYNWPEVEREMARALELDPTSPVVRLRCAVNGLMPHGRLEEAIARTRTRTRIGPAVAVCTGWLAVMLLLWRKYDRAIEEARRLLDLYPSAHWGYLVIGSCRREQRRFDESIAAHRTAVELSGGSRQCGMARSGAGTGRAGGRGARPARAPSRDRVPGLRAADGLCLDLPRPRRIRHRLRVAQSGG